MECIVNAREAKEIDRISMEEIGIPSMVLMERAALAVFEKVRSLAHKESRILVICGMGNNGGDGVATARLLWEAGYDVTILLVGKEEAASTEMKKQLEIARNLDIKTSNRLPVEEYNILIDAILGIGLSREIVGAYQNVIQWMNQQEAVRIAVDIPSGISASTGKIFGCCVQADFTVTFGCLKRGLLLFPGAGYTGEIIRADVGFPQEAIEKAAPRAFTLNESDAWELIPKRIQRSNKGSYGNVLIVAGSPNMCGACFFAAEAAYRVGCGLVKIFTAKENINVLKSQLPEALLQPIPGDWKDTSEEILQARKEVLAEAIEWSTSIVVGPGIGTSSTAQQMLRQIMLVTDRPVVLDADALNILSDIDDVMITREDGSRKVCLRDNFIMTPHLKEMSRLVKIPVEQIQENLVDQALQSLQIGDCQTLVLKDARTVVSNGTKIFINSLGNNGLSTGGSGDVLSGMIGGLLAQKSPVYESCVAAVALHGMTAQEYCKKGSRYAMMASDILQMLPDILPN